MDKLKQYLLTLKTEDLKSHLNLSDGSCDNCFNRSVNLRIDLCPGCYKEIIVGSDYTIKQYLATIKEILDERRS